MRLNGHYDMLPERAFTKKLGGYAPATLEGGKGGGGGAPSPDPQIGKAQQQMADLAKQQYEDFKTNIWPTLQKQAESQTDMATKLANQQYETTQKQNAIAEEAYARYKEKGIPIQDALFKEAQAAGSEQEQQQQASQAIGDVQSQMAAARANTQRNMQSYGIDPTSGAYQGQANANEIMGAATGAAAATRARNAAIQLGWAKKMDAAGLAQGQFGNQASSTGLALTAGNTALGSGAAGMGATNALGNSYVQGTGAAMQGWNNIGQLGVQKYNADVNAYSAQQANDPMKTILGAAAGVGTSFALKSAMSDIRTKENIEFIGYLPNGLGVYEYEYKPEFKDHPLAGHGKFRGVMAHEVEKLIPNAVFETKDGYKAVDYSKIN
jgi:hypothetical protein